MHDSGRAHHARIPVPEGTRPGAPRGRRPSAPFLSPDEPLACSPLHPRRRTTMSTRSDQAPTGSSAHCGPPRTADVHRGGGA